MHEILSELLLHLASTLLNNSRKNGGRIMSRGWRAECGVAKLLGDDHQGILWMAKHRWSGADQPVRGPINPVWGIDRIEVLPRCQDGAKRVVMALFKRMIHLLSAMIVLALAMPLAHAGNSQGRGQRQQQPSDQRETTQSYGDRDSGGKRSQRLSPEERRQLRRDIKEAGREVYSPRR